jgi:hypothetical protein
MAKAAGGPMEEAEFWQRLEFRISAEFKGFDDHRLRFYWCDGLYPEEYDLAGRERRITGVALCGNSGQERWQFTLVLGPETASGDQIDWSALLPSARLTGWLTPDTQNKTLRVDPLSGYGD